MIESIQPITETDIDETVLSAKIECEFCKEEEYFDKEPDSGPVYCTLEWPSPVE